MPVAGLVVTPALETIADLSTLLALAMTGGTATPCFAANWSTTDCHSPFFFAASCIC